MKHIHTFLLLCIALGGMIISGCDATSPENTNAPYSVELQKINDTTIKLSWSYNAADADTVRFTIARKMGEQSWNESYEAVDDQLYLFDNIDTQDSLVYAYKVKALNVSEEYETPFSKAVAHMSDATAPTDLSITQPSEETITLTWIDHCYGEQGYYIDRKIADNDWERKIADLPEDAVSFTDQSILYSDVVYSIYAYFEDADSPALQDTIAATLAAPSDLIITKPDVTKIHLSWTDNSNDETSFRIDRRIGLGEWQENIATTGVDSTSWIDDITLPAATLSYRVFAINGIYTSLASEVVSTNVRLNQVGAIDTPGNATGIAVSNLSAFVADYYEGLAVIDCFNPSNPQISNTVQLPDRTLSCAVDENFVYTTGNSGSYPGLLTKIDFTDLSNPVITGSTATSGIANDISISGDFAYVAEGENGLTVVHVAMYTPAYVTTLPLGGHARSLTVSGQYAYIALGLDGLSIVDIINPNAPVQISTVSTNGLTQAIALTGTRALVANGEDGVEVLDVTNPAAPVALSTIALDGFICDIAIAGNYAYAVDKDNGMYVLDITVPSQPAVIGMAPMDTEPVAVELSGSYAYITDNQGLKILQVKE